MPPERRAFGKAINEFQSLQFKLADMATNLEAARVMLYAAASAYDRQDHPDDHALRDGQAVCIRYRVADRR